MQHLERHPSEDWSFYILALYVLSSSHVWTIMQISLPAMLGAVCQSLQQPCT